MTDESTDGLPPGAEAVGPLSRMPTKEAVQVLGSEITEYCRLVRRAHHPSKMEYGIMMLVRVGYVGIRQLRDISNTLDQIEARG